MRPKKSFKKQDPRLEVLLERLMDQMPGDTIKHEGQVIDPPVSVADPALYTPPQPYHEGAIKKGPSDPLLEDVLEFIDPTGISSHDDAKRAYASYIKRKEESGADFMLPTFDEFVDAIGAVPFAGKVGKILKGGKGAVSLGSRGYRAIKSYLPKALKAAGFVADRTEHYRDES